MSSERKILANRRNALRSTGPKTLAGKRNSSRNSIKTGLFSRKVVISEADKPIFDTLRRELSQQLTPATPLQWIGFDRVLICCWRCRSASWMETQRIDKLINPPPQTGDAVPAPEINPQMLRWFGASRRDLNIAIRILQDVREDVSRHGKIRESWKDSLTQCFGPELYTALQEWSPMSKDAFLLANMLVDHSKKFKLPLPRTNSDTVYVRDPQQEQQMIMKILDLYLNCLAAARKMSEEGTVLSSETSSGVSLEFTRYLSEAMRNLEDAVEWFIWLKAVGL